MGFWIFIIIALLVSISMSGKKTEKIHDMLAEKIVILETHRHHFSAEDNKKVVQVLENYRNSLNSPNFSALLYATRKRAMKDLEMNKSRVDTVYREFVNKYEITNN